MSTIEALRTKIEALIPYMDEQPRGLWAGSEALVLGSEGIKKVTFATGLSSNRIRAGTKELKISAPSQKEVKLETNSTDGVRKAGGGRKKISRYRPKFDGKFRRFHRASNSWRTLFPVALDIKKHIKISQSFKRTRT
jgi:hypothetical protein